MEIGGLSDCNDCWHAGGRRGGGGSAGRSGAGGQGAKPRRGVGGGSRQNVTKRNLNVSWTNFVTKWSMICEDKETNDNCARARAHTHIHTLAPIVAGISPATTCWRWFYPPLRLIPVCLNSPFPMLTKQILSHYFQALQILNDVMLYSVRYGSSISSQYCSEREERVPLSLYFISILWRCIPQTPK